MMPFRYFLIALLISGFLSDKSDPTLFELLFPQQTGINFINTVEEKPGNNILESEFFYNGGGVAVGDINNNGFPDIFFTANQGANALYINEGNYRFRNIAESAGIEDKDGWSTGTAMVDINGNGLLDIYVCKAGKLDESERKNRLFINNGDLTFTERAAEFGLDDAGYCTQPVFFDYNRNGLLDLFIVNYNTRNFASFDITTIRDEHDPFAGDKLFRNNGDGTFTDVSREAGILQNPIGFGLSATVSDLNGNGWPDIYVTNDFMERDYMYINQGDGTFRDEILLRTDVTSYFSMGSDIADINNNGLPDIFVADMLPPDYERMRVFKTPNYDIYDRLVANQYHRKNMRNTLQVNNGDGTFTETGRLSGVAASDWSWATLLADFDNDGRNDLYITNGFPRFYTDLDYLNNILWDAFPDEDLPDNPFLKYSLVLQMEEVEMHNMAFKNMGDLSFRESTEVWGLKTYTVSGGAAYADLNNNGALDLIVSNMNEPPSIFRNNATELYNHNYLKIELNGPQNNTHGIGSKIKLTASDGSVYFREAYQTRGFQSSVEPVLHFGLGEHDVVDAEITWPDQTVQKLRDISANQTITLSHSDASEDIQRETPRLSAANFQLLDPSALGIDFTHSSGVFTDRVTTPLLTHTISNLGPAMAVGDINNDGLPDLYIGGGQDQPGQIFLQQPDGTFSAIETPNFELHSHHVDTDAVFFDANGNGHQDLYVVSGGNFDRFNGENYQDRLYLNNGFGGFTHAPDALPQMHSSGSSVTLLDIDNNGETDLFVGGRVLTGQYPSPPRSFLLKNEGGTFRDVTGDKAPYLMRPGMVTDSKWADITGNGVNEIIIVGEWMPVRVFTPDEAGVYREITEDLGLELTGGWWNTLETADLNGNGYVDLIAGNRGLNSLIDLSAENPLILHRIDYNNNGIYDPVISQVVNNKRVPLYGRDLMIRQLPGLQDKFPTYESYAKASFSDIFGDELLDSSRKYYAHMFETTVFINDGTGKFNIQPLPNPAQSAPVHSIVVADFFENNIPDILLAGNNFGFRPEKGPTSNTGFLLKGTGNATFDVLSAHETGFYGDGDIRSLEFLPSRLGSLFLIGRYGESVIPYSYSLQKQQ